MSQYEVMEMDISQEDNDNVIFIQDDHIAVIQQSDIQQADVHIVDNNATTNTGTSIQPDTVTDTGISSTQVYSVMPSGRNTGIKSNLIQTNVNLLCLSPKPASSNQGTSQNEFKDNDRSKHVENEKEDEESEYCPICFEQWSNSGPHRLSSLNCGHLFGRSCIEKWLRTKGRDKCPQCNAPAKRHQIRNIYAKVIKALDTAERDATLKELEKERKARIAAEKKQKQAEEAEINANIQCQMIKAECERMRMRAENAQKRAQESVITLRAEYERLKKDLGTNKNGFDQIPCSQSFNHRFVFESSLHISQNGARVMAFDCHNDTLIASKPSPNSNNPSYGIVKISCMNFKASKYIALHSKPIRDAVFSNQSNNLLLTTGVDKKLQITNINTDTTVLSYTLPASSWCCCWDTTDQNYVFAGLQNGQCHVFDIRYTATTLQVLSCQERYPLVSLYFVPQSLSGKMKDSGLLTCSLETGHFWQKNYLPLNYHSDTNLKFPTGSCTCLCYDPETQHCILSQRPSKECNRSRHTTLSLSSGIISTDDNNGISEERNCITCEPVVQFFAGTSQNRLCHSTTFTCPENKNLYGCVGDEASNTVLLWDALTGKKIQEIPSQTPAMDVCTFQANDTNFLAVLTEQNLSFHKWTSSH